MPVRAITLPKVVKRLPKRKTKKRSLAHRNCGSVKKMMAKKANHKEETRKVFGQWEWCRLIGLL
ncbi:MAG: hypothetical protein A2365_02100 [Candidatus Nealsonbacteria bacterium RIFOXYB1_FULL_40_15]|uniref:Uncharacterized protein n=1 Tax=Candidatus Nealsonbacteria bacterium RIFOXYB1_FULL_40_15 TaxID=1801677 RepID=A0A1G2EM07_9BACT|nr:MAG: hypothetical protein A2365_02100 [Candidatus Nealsonbacteria bacterium RIFOXYB1_FULL_40_15]